MTATSQVQGPVSLKNVGRFMALTQRLIDRDPHLPGIGVCSGHSGLGKTYASIYAQNKTRAIRVEVGDSWTRRTFLQAILREVGTPFRGRVSIAELAEKVIGALGDDPSRPLIIDEGDKLVDKGLIEIVREIHEHSGAPVVLIGEERLPDKLLTVERVHNRVLDWFQAQPCDIDDAKALAAAFASKTVITDDLLELILRQSQGRARRIVVNVARVGEFARNKGLHTVDAKKWGGEPFFTGEPPTARNVKPYERSSKLQAAA